MTGTRRGLLLALLFASAVEAATVSGRVFERTEDAGLGGLTMKLAPRSGVGTVLIGSTRSDGTYRLERVRNGSYTLEVLQGLKVVASARLTVNGDTTHDFSLQRK